MCAGDLQLLPVELPTFHRDGALRKCYRDGAEHRNGAFRTFIGTCIAKVFKTAEAKHGGKSHTPLSPPEPPAASRRHAKAHTGWTMAASRAKRQEVGSAGKAFYARFAGMSGECGALWRGISSSRRRIEVAK
jgi:hypothetical protein